MNVRKLVESYFKEDVDFDKVEEIINQYLPDFISGNSLDEIKEKLSKEYDNDVINEAMEGLKYYKDMYDSFCQSVKEYGPMHARDDIRADELSKYLGSGFLDEILNKGH